MLPFLDNRGLNIRVSLVIAEGNSALDNYNEQTSVGSNNSKFWRELHKLLPNELFADIL